MPPVEKLVYGGYVNYPLAPKDIKQVKQLQEAYSTPEELLGLILWFASENFGLKIEPMSEPIGNWKVVIYNLSPVKDGDNHSYYISGESDALVKALCVVRHKLSSLVKAELSSWVAAPQKSEYR
jgi:hypothetical protein